MAKRRVVKDEPFSGSSYVVEGRLFRTRAEAIAYCKVERISVYKIGLAPPVDDAIKLSVGRSWSLRVFYGGDDPVLIFGSNNEVQAFTVRMSDLAELVLSVKARVRELAKSGELL